MWRTGHCFIADKTTIGKNGTFPSEQNCSELRTKERMENSFQMIIFVCLNAAIDDCNFSYPQREHGRKAVTKTKEHIALYHPNTHPFPGIAQ